MSKSINRPQSDQNSFVFTRWGHEYSYSWLVAAGVESIRDTSLCLCACLRPFRVQTRVTPFPVHFISLLLPFAFSLSLELPSTVKNYETSRRTMPFTWIGKNSGPKVAPWGTPRSVWFNPHWSNCLTRLSCDIIGSRVEQTIKYLMVNEDDKSPKCY